MVDNFDVDCTFYNIIQKQLVSIISDEREVIKGASLLIAQTIKNDGLIHIFGTGHSHIFAEEAFFSRRRAGLCQPGTRTVTKAAWLKKLEGGNCCR